MKRFKTLAVTLAMVAMLGACKGDKSGAEQASENDTKETGDQMAVLTDAQPTIRVPYSQVRQTIILAEWIAATGAATHTFVFIPGGQNSAPIFECDSAGFPVPGTYNITNPLVEDPNHRAEDGIVVNQAEPTLGVYTGDSQGTYVVCLTDGGKPYVQWAEGIVQGGYPIGSHWDDTTHRIVVPSDAEIADTPVPILPGG